MTLSLPLPLSTHGWPRLAFLQSPSRVRSPQLRFPLTQQRLSSSFLLTSVFEKANGLHRLFPLPNRLDPAKEIIGFRPASRIAHSLPCLGRRRPLPPSSSPHFLPFPSILRSLL